MWCVADLHRATVYIMLYSCIYILSLLAGITTVFNTWEHFLWTVVIVIKESYIHFKV